MAKNREGTNIVDMIDPPPPGFNVSRESWSATPEVMRLEILRSHREQSEGIAILKDRRAGRNVRVPGRPDPGKRVRGGWWELHMCEVDGSPTKLARAAELRLALAPEQKQFDDYDDIDRVYGSMARAGGTTVGAALRRYVNMENFIREDPVKGFELLCQNLRIDPIAMAKRLLAEPEPAALAEAGK